MLVLSVNPPREKMNRFSETLVLLITLGLLGYSGIVYADPYLDFNMDATHPTGALISYAGGTGALTGFSLSVDTVTGFESPNNSGVTLTIVGGRLNFTTGSFAGNDPNNWYFGGGGSITITGGIDLDPNKYGLEIPLDSTLLSGTFTSANVTNIGGRFKIAGASFDDWKDQQLTDFYGLPNLSGNAYDYSGNFNISFFASGSPPQAFQSSSILSGDVVNNPVPEPATVSLFGCGLIGLAWFGRRKSRKV